MADYVIGFDFGNYYAQLCCIEDMDPKTRRGGTFRTLLDSSSSNVHGIPSAFFWSENVNGGQPLFGTEAEEKRPSGNCLRYMKMHMGETVTLYSKYDEKGAPVGNGRTFSYDEIITLTVQYQVRHANRELKRATGKTTNKIALTYPAILHSGQRAHLVSLVEKATMEDGKTHLQVMGTIKEPAAAALNYLAEHPGRKETVTAMVADLGAGTFDLSVVEAYPKGRPHANGEGKYYYDVKWDDGSSRVAGLMFTDRLFQYVRSQIKFDLRRRQLDDLMRDAENAKRRLSEFESTTITVSGPDDDVDIDISRGKFEELTRDLMDQIIEKIRSALNRSNVPTPDVIVITGGASRMPMVERRIVESFPQYKGKVACHKPGEAIAHGAARYAVQEQDDDIRQGAKQAGEGAIIKRTTYDIGIRYHDVSKEGEPIYVEILVPKESRVPFESKTVQSEVRKAARKSLFIVVEANCKDPDPYQPERDWREVTRITVDHGRIVQPGTPTDSRISIDGKEMLHLLVSDPQNKDAKLAETFSENLNLTNF